MMKKGLKSTAILVLMAMLLTVVAGCQSPPTTTVSTTETSSTGGATAETTVDTSPITLKWYVPSNANIVSGIQTDPIALEIKNKLGITLDLEATNTDKVTVMVASGDIPDLFSYGTTLFIKPLVESGTILDLDDLVLNAPNIQKNAAAMLSYSKENLSNGTNKLYVLTQRTMDKATPLSEQDIGGILMRWSYYKELNYPEITSTDDLVAVLKQMQDAHPTTPDGQKVYGVATWTDWGIFTFAGNYFSESLRGITAFQSGGEYNTLTEEYIGLMDDRSTTWSGSEFYNKAYRAGILDPESFTQKYENVFAKMMQGRVLSSFFGWMTAAPNSVFTATGVDDAFVNIPVADIPEFPVAYDRIVPFGYTYRCVSISSKCEYPERAMQLLDYCWSEEGDRTLLSGVKGRTWNDESGKAEFTADALAKLADTAWQLSEGIGIYTGINGLDYSVADANGVYLNMIGDPSIIAASYNPAQKDYLAHFNITNMNEGIAARTNKTTINMGITALGAPLPDDLTLISSNITTYLIENLSVLVQCETDEAYAAKKDEIKAAILSMGQDKLDAFAKDQYEKAVEKMDKYLGK